MATGEAKTSQRRSADDSQAPARARLLEATAELLRTGGANQITSRAIAEASGENLAAITYYFGSKDDLVNQAMLSVAERLIGPVLDEMAKPGAAPAESLLIGIQQLNLVLKENRSKIPAYVHSLAAASTDPKLAAESRRLHHRLTKTLADLISHHQDVNDVPRWIEPMAMAQLIVAVTQGVAVAVAIDDQATVVADGEGATLDDPVEPDLIASQFAQLILAGQNYGGSAKP